MSLTHPVSPGSGAQAARGLDYAPDAAIYDEMIAPDGSLRPAWRASGNWFAGTAFSVQRALAGKIERLIAQNFSDPARGNQLWHLNLMPLVFDSGTWAVIEAAARQRAALYTALLADLYGPQSLIRDGVLPATLIQSDGSFLRPLVGVQPAQGHLTFLALDFARDPAGNWRVLDAHTETPAGHGYALTNRMVFAEVFGGLFRRSRAQRIGKFYQQLSDDLLRRAGTEDPTIAVLAPQPDATTFVGHSYFARYLGALRVDGFDLRILGNRAYLKTIKGLRKIDLLVRAVEGQRCDPLELSPDGFDGPVGLVEACRQNPNLIVNALGTAVVENRGLSGYLGALSQRLLGEDLRIHDSPRLWLGDPAARARVLDSLDEHIIHDAQEGTGKPGAAMPGRSARDMAPQDRQALIEDIRFNGHHYVAERPLGFATAPVWSPDGLKPEPYALRIFVAAVDGEFMVMPGGLALTVDGSRSVTLSSSDARSRDVWVTSEGGPAPSISLRRIAAQNAAVQRYARGLQSRLADNLFWLGRYCERADGTLRVLRQTLHLSTAEPTGQPTSDRPLMALRILVGDSGADAAEVVDTGKPAPAAGGPNAALQHAVAALCADATRPYGLPQTFRNIRNIAVQCRERLSEDTWRILSGLASDTLASIATPANADGGAASPLAPESATTGETMLANTYEMIEACEQLIERLAAVAGMSHENMTRNSGWRFFDLGRRVERALHMAELLRLLMQSSETADLENDDMTFALEAADSFITFRSRYRFAPEPHLVLDLLMIDERNPRSLVYQLSALSDHIGQLPKAADDAVRAPDQRLALDLLTKVRLADVEALATPDEDGNRAALDALLTEVIEALPRLSELISRQYFSLADERPRRLHPLSTR